MLNNTAQQEDPIVSDVSENQLLLVIIAILLPPVAVLIKSGFGLAFILNLVLCLLFYIPGLIHALYVVLKT